jgi:hypothetical protein
MTYEMRYCAFVDILGFTEVINELRRGGITYEELRATLDVVHRPPLADVDVFRRSGLKVQSISDAVCVSAAHNASGLNHMLNSLEALTISLLDKGRFVRGAVVKGKLYHDDKMVFGEAQIRAYNLENNIARFPRIMLARDVAISALELPRQFPNDVIDFVRQSTDGPFFLHVLSAIVPILESAQDPHDRSNHLARYNLIASKIQQRFDDAVDNPRHFEKVQWFARYWNETTGPFRDEISAVTGPGMNTFD